MGNLKHWIDNMRHSKRRKDPGRKDKKAKSNLKAKRRKEYRQMKITDTDKDKNIDKNKEEDLAVLAAKRRRAIGLSESDSEYEWDSDDDWGAEDFEDNLTYHEDTLSVMKGVVTTPLGAAVPVWVTTDSGSMTQLMQSDFARNLKLPTREIPTKHCFNIASPGGGREYIDKFVVLPLRVIAKREGPVIAAYGDNHSEEEVVTVKMKFGLCESLPVPLLWGGKQMRGYDLVDYHRNKTLSLKLEEQRYVTKSMSWLVASAEMAQQSDKAVRKLYKSFCPTKERLINMVRGERRTINLPTALYPGRDTVVRVGRHNARIDEGYNQIVALNGEAVAERYRGWVTVIDSVANGEAFIIVRNNSTHALSLPAGIIEIAVRPALCLPRIIAPSELDKFEGEDRTLEERSSLESAMGVKQALSTLTEHVTLEEELQGELSPRKFISWNCNGLSTRIRKRELDELFYAQIVELDPDVVSLQEVRLQCEPGRPGEVLKGSVDAENWEAFMDPLRGRYDAYLSLDPLKYGGQAVLVKKHLTSPVVTYNMHMKPGHYESGRFIKLEFGNVIVRSVYAPFNGTGKPGHLERRQGWDEDLFRETYAWDDSPKGRVLMGDFNAVYRDSDMSNHPEFWRLQGSQEVAKGDRGFGGTTLNERTRFRDILECGSLADTFTAPSGRHHEARWTYRGQGKFQGKGLKLDYILADDTILLSGGVKSSRVLCSGSNRDGFMGSDHAPLFCELHERWAKRVANHNSHYSAVRKRSEGHFEKLTGNYLSHPGSEEFKRKMKRTEERHEMGVMFAGTRAAETLPKAQRIDVSDERLEDWMHQTGWQGQSDGGCDGSGSMSLRERAAKTEEDRLAMVAKAELGAKTPRPDAFPEHLWKYVDPKEKGVIAARFASFKSKEYLEDCVEQVVKDLDIQERDEEFELTWRPKVDKENWKEKDVMLAQAVANLDIYFFPDPDKVKMAKDVVAEIETMDDKPVKCRMRKLSVVQQAFLEAKTSIMMRMKQLEEATSDWCHGLVLVAYEERINKFMETHGDKAMERMFLPEHETEVATFFRLCIDLRMLNAKTIPDRFPLPRIDDLLESIPRHCGRYSISDIADAFFKCEVRKEHRHKTAFKTHNRHLQFSVLPQGFINSPSVFCRLIAKTFEGVDRRRFSAYIDDVLNHTEDFETHIGVQQDMYDRLRSSQLTLKLSKTHLNYSEVKFLGHILTKEGRLPDPKAVEAIREWADPTTAKEVRSFLGATLYYREYIYQYSDMAMPLYDLIRKGVVVEKVWDPLVHGRAVERIKEALTSKPVLMQVDNTKRFRLKVDACRVGRGIGCILEQQNDQGKWQPVSYFSSSLSKEERNYSATELECKALHDCILHYAVYLKYIPHFEVFSDHNALRYMVNSENATTNGRLMRYLLDLQEYNFAIYYRRGTENCDADAVSRLKRTSDQPVYLTEDDLSQENGVVSTQMLQRARSLDVRNKNVEKEARKLLSKIARDDLTEMSILNDHILAEGVENLESESGRARFFENIKKKHGMTCTREKLNATLDSMTAEQGGMADEGAIGVMDLDEPRVANLVQIWEESGAVDSKEEVALTMSVMESKLGEQPMAVPYSEDLDKASSDAELPGLLIQMVGAVQLDIANCGQKPSQRHDLVLSTIRGLRGEIKGRIKDLGVRSVRVLAGRTTRAQAKKAKTHPEGQSAEKAADEPRVREGKESEDSDEIPRSIEMDTAPTRSTRKLRTVARVDYNCEVKSPPNWIKAKEKDPTLTCERQPVNDKLEAMRKEGYGVVEVRNSLIPGDSGMGLFAKKRIKKGTAFCSYGGVEVTEEMLKQGYGNRDYVASAYKNHRTKEVIYIDGEEELSGMGRFVQDPIDDHLVNAKILWREGRLVMIAMVDLEPGDEIYAEYGLDYWKGRLHFLHPDLRSRIEGKYQRRTVRFEQEVTRCDFKEDQSPSQLRNGKTIREEGEPLQRTPDNLQTRAERFNPEENTGEVTEADPADSEEARILEETSFENVNECEELGEELQFLNGRRFRDEGRLYEIMQVRYDEEWGHVIGFRKPLSGRLDKEDGCPFLVFGREGLYELSERYLVEHPDDRDEVRWPRTSGAWAKLQRLDEDLVKLIENIQDTGGLSLKVGRNKYSLKPTEDGTTPILVRVVSDHKKGVVEQLMVPRCLAKATMKAHHEGFGHMGVNRMVETIKLRYFWTKMETDIVQHTSKCINCKLRKVYQRKPSVPIMKYDDTSRPLDRVHVDLTGPLPTSKAGHRYVMVIKDYLTKYVWLVPLKTKGAVEVAEAFVGEFICHAGIPGRVVSDRGNEFVNHILANVSKIMGINRVSTTPYNPRSDGFVENHNKTLKDQLFHYVDTLKQDDWDVYLPTVQLMYNTTVSLATGYTPMLLMTGREARMPAFEHMDSELDKRCRKDPLSNEFVLKMVESMRGYREHALRQTAKNKGRLNERIRKPLEFKEYEPGQEFLRVRRPISTFKSADEEESWKISMKLMERYEGPYKIIRKINPVVYDADINGKEVRVHAANMKPY